MVQMIEIPTRQSNKSSNTESGNFHVEYTDEILLKIAD